MMFKTDDLLNAIDELVTELPPQIVGAIAITLESVIRVDPGSLQRFGATHGGRNRIEKLEELLGLPGAPATQVVALALRSSLHSTQRMSASGRIEIAWTGPDTSFIPARRVDQTMYEMIETAQSSLVLASYVTAGVANTLAALDAATKRGVAVSLVLERAELTDGRLKFDGFANVRQRVPEASIYYWPVERRGVSNHGAPGIFHVKCLIRDEVDALVSSANLTDFGLELNMELGLALRGGELPRRLAGHFAQMMRQGDLVEWK